ncbi:hypothetical protein BGZ59_009304 [Podila verticillata]|nr:hypothetical protein BGZ59_009304 [Podila verticillata]
MGTKVVSFEQDSEQVSIQRADGSMHQGDILVAADESLDPEEYPRLKLEHSQFYFVVGDDDYSEKKFRDKNSI